MGTLRFAHPTIRAPVAARADRIKEGRPCDDLDYDNDYDNDYDYDNDNDNDNDYENDSDNDG